MTRREFIKKMIIGAGLLFCGCEHLLGDDHGRERGRERGGALPIRSDNPSIRLHHNRCRNCGRCRGFCRNTMGVFGQAVPAGEDTCTYCGQCTLFCTRAITERYHYREVNQAISAAGKIVIATTAPAIRVALGEMYRLSPGTNVEGKIVGALKHIGVDHVLDATFAADLTVMEEASELLERLENNSAKNPLPMFTSCCPAWIRFVKLFYPSFLPNLSTVKSPLLMQGTLVKTYFAQKTGIDPAKIVCVALTPCTAKKAEILLPGKNAAGVMHGKAEMRDVDFVLTCRELAYLLNLNNVNFLQMQDAPYSSLMGTGSGAGMIFGNTGGVMEASLRTAYRLLNNKNPPAKFFNLTPIRGLNSVRSASVDLGVRTLNVAVAHGTGGLRPFLESIQSGVLKYDFIEVMACSGGCIGGGGQPVTLMGPTRLKQLRKNALYQRDIGSEIRLSYDNPQIKAIYNDFLSEPLSNKAKELLHIYR
ncbi:MAG: [FeFe] hydrogenase, group A [Treponema sp.]|nr:[FeFe] hydrogenase, group A [Treponema sp.]